MVGLTYPERLARQHGIRVGEKYQDNKRARRNVLSEQERESRARCQEKGIPCPPVYEGMGRRTYNAAQLYAPKRVKHSANKDTGKEISCDTGNEDAIFKHKGSTGREVYVCRRGHIQVFQNQRDTEVAD